MARSPIAPSSADQEQPINPAHRHARERSKPFASLTVRETPVTLRANRFYLSRDLAPEKTARRKAAPASDDTQGHTTATRSRFPTSATLARLPASFTRLGRSGSRR